jgi:hypothetical protein
LQRFRLQVKPIQTLMHFKKCEERSLPKATAQLNGSFILMPEDVQEMAKNALYVRYA